MSDVEIPDQEFTPELRSAGWAPGNYLCKCHDCGKVHQADKRAMRCVACANGRLAEKAASQADDVPAQTIPEIIARLRNLPQQIGDIGAEALETLAGEVKDLETELEYVKKQREDYFAEYSQKLTEYTEMKIALAKLAPVVEAARWYFKTMQDGKLSHEREEAADSLFHALATLEAAHD